MKRSASRRVVSPGLAVTFPGHALRRPFPVHAVGRPDRELERHVRHPERAPPR